MSNDFRLKSTHVIANALAQAKTIEEAEWYLEILNYIKYATVPDNKAISFGEYLGNTPEKEGTEIGCS